MLEVLAYLRVCDFSTYIVSGGGVELMRVFADEVCFRNELGVLVQRQDVATHSPVRQLTVEDD